MKSLARVAPKPNRVCPLCGGPNECAVARSGDFATLCWCREVTFDAAVLARVPEAQRDQSCICKKCAAATSRDN